MEAPNSSETPKRRGRTPRGEKKEYLPGDAIHIIITQDFAPVANQFFEYCRENNFNASEVIRSCIKRWVAERKREDIMRTSFDEKLLKLLEETRMGGAKRPSPERVEMGGIKIYRLGEE